MLKSTDYNKLLIISEAKDLINTAKNEGAHISFSEALEVIKICKLKAISESLNQLIRRQ